MNTNDLLLRWSHMTLDQIEDEIRTGKDKDSAVQLLGPETVAEMRAVSFAPPQRSAPDPVVLLPGIMGSDLSSIRGVTTLVWVNPLIFVEGNARFLALNEDYSQDGCLEVDMVPVGIAKLVYLKIELALNKTAELFEFPYDWRRPITYNADVLHACLERWAGGSNRKFVLVGHSMGGLVSRTYMARHPEAAEKRVRRLIMLGTPNYGATNAVETLFGGNSLMATVQKLNPANNMKEVVRGLPGVYNLLPAPPEFFPGGKSYPADWNLYDAASWQIAGIEQRLLDNTYALWKDLAAADPQVPQTMIAGCNLETLVRVSRDLADESNPLLVGDRITAGPDGGDATVPLWSALLPGADTYYVQEKHGDLPGNRRVIQSVLDLIQGQMCALDADLPELKGRFDLPFETPGEPSAEVLEARIRSGTADKNDLKQLYFAL